MTQKSNVFLVGLDEFNLEILKALPQSEYCDFHAALSLAEMRDEAVDLDILALAERAAERMQAVPGGPAGVASFFDFPGTLIAAMLAERLDLPGPELASVLKCEHKYWSRLEQQKVAADIVPAFRAFDPFDDDAYSKVDLLPPFWIKPVKSFRSYLAFAIQDERQFKEVMQPCREQAPELIEPFRRLLRATQMPEELAAMPETFIAESTIGGAQCTLEGYVYHGDVVVYGVVDSIREPDSSSFARYEYPSMLPLEIQHRMIDAIRKVMQQFEYRHGPFNAEFFYDQTNDHIWLLEINPRASQSHADLFLKVNGVSHLSVVVDLALGRKPAPFMREGPWAVAGHCFARAHEPGIVVRVPDQQSLATLARRQPDTRIQIEVQQGTDLATLPNQDSYSFELASLYIGGRDRLDLLGKYQEAMEILDFEIEPESKPRIA